MGTRYDVRVTEAISSATHYDVGCACSCGWSSRRRLADEPQALAAAAGERLAHLLDAHPRQGPSAFVRPRAHARYRHPRTAGVATADGRRWARWTACGCGWSERVRGGSPAATARRARARHRVHLQLQTGRAPWRDYAVMAAVLLVVAGVLLALAVVAIQASGGDPGDLTRVSSH